MQRNFIHIELLSGYTPKGDDTIGGACMQHK